MQIRRNYESTNRFHRAEQHRKDAQALEKAGFMMFAELNWQMAEMLDPYIEEEYPE